MYMYMLNSQAILYSAFPKWVATLASFEETGAFLQISSILNTNVKAVPLSVK